MRCLKHVSMHTLCSKEMPAFASGCNAVCKQARQVLHRLAAGTIDLMMQGTRAALLLLPENNLPQAE